MVEKKYKEIMEEIGKLNQYYATHKHEKIYNKINKWESKILKIIIDSGLPEQEQEKLSKMILPGIIYEPWDEIWELGKSIS